MKNVLLILVLLLSKLSFSQTLEDYNKVVSTITDGYNSNDIDSIIAISCDQLLETMLQQNTTAFAMEDHATIINLDQDNTGKISETEFIMDNEKEKQFLVQFENTTKVMFVALCTKKNITSLRIEDY